MLAITQRRRSEHRGCQGAQHFLGEIHEVAVVAVGLVELEHGELGVVLGRNAFVPEISVDLEHLFESAHHQALEIELGRDAQEEVHVERVMMRLERLRVRAAGNRLHHRRLDLEETPARHEFADRVHNAAARLEHAARLLAHDEVHVALAVLLLLVRESVEFLRQRPQRLHEQTQLRHFKGKLAGLGLEKGSARAEDVAEVVMLEGLVRSLADGVARNVELDAAAHVLHGRETGLAHEALEHHAAGDGRFHGLRLDLLVGFPAPGLVQVGCEVLAAEVVREGGAALSQFGELRAPLRDYLVFVLLQRLLGHRCYTPFFKLAVMKSSRSPSSTLCVSPFSTPVRRSLMRDWSST